MISCNMKPALLLALFSCTCVASQDINYFIETPANTTVTMFTSSDSPLLWGDFTCATRLGSHPLWIVNGVSISIITETAGYNGTYSEFFLLQGDGNSLSFLSIPASPATNNSVVTCAATASRGSNPTILAYSNPVHLLVVLNALGNTSVTLNTPNTSSEPLPPSASAGMPGTGPTADLMNTSHQTRNTKLIASVSIMCGLISIFMITLLFLIVFFVLRRNRNFKKIKHTSKGGNHTAQSNTYWNPKEENTPNVVNMNYDKQQYLNEQCT